MNLRSTDLAGRTLALVLLAALATATSANEIDGRWHFKLEPYLWLPNANVNVDTTVGGLPGPLGGEARSVDVSAKTDPSDYLSNLQVALMLIGEARKDRWSVFTDLIYVDFGTQDSRVRSVTGPLGERSTDISRKASIDLSTTIWTLAGGYSVVQSPSATVDLFAGFRYLVLDSSLKLNVQDSSGRFYRAKSASMDQQPWDGIIGARGRVMEAEEISGNVNPIDEGDAAQMKEPK